jgi:O-antigen ligase
VETEYHIVYQDSFFNRVKPYIVWFVLILPALISQLSGFSTTYENNALIAEEGSLSGKLLYILLFCISVFFIWRYKLKIFWSIKVYFLIAFLFLGLLYSDYPYMVIRGIFVAVTSLLLWNISAQILLFDFDIKRLINSIPIFFLLWGLLELIFWGIHTKDYYDYGFMANYIGYFFQPNLLAKLLCIGIIFKFFEIHYDKKSINNFMQISVLFLLYFTGSRTSFASLLTAIFVVQFFNSDLTTKSKFKYAVGILLLIVIFYFLFKDFFVKHNINGILYDSTLTARADVWFELLPIMLKNFLLGAGINSFWNANLFYNFNLNVPGIHNGYLQVFQDLGLIGFSLLLIIIIQIIKSIKIRIEGDQYLIFRYSLITSWIYFFIVNLTEGDLGNYRSSLWAVLMTISLVWYYLIKEYNTDQS